MASARPQNVLFYYGYLNSFNSATNGWNNENVAMDMAKYDICVFGDGIQDSSHPDYANTQIIIARLKAIKPDMEIYGYVSANQDIADFQTKVNQWDTLQVNGIFIDEAGYDYGTTRDEQNACVQHVRSKTYAKKCFVNAWNMDHIIGTTNDASYPNSIFNPDLHVALLDSRDIYLLESFAVNTGAYSENNGYATQADVLARGNKAVSHNITYGIKLATVGVIDNGNASGQTLSNFAYHSAVTFGVDFEGTSDTNYGASSAAVKFWNKPGTKHIGRTTSITVVQNLADTDILVRFGDHAKVSLDFSTGAQTSSITSW
jgi:hypothetical protein